MTPFYEILEQEIADASARCSGRIRRLPEGPERDALLEVRRILREAREAVREAGTW